MFNLSGTFVPGWVMSPSTSCAAAATEDNFPTGSSGVEQQQEPEPQHIRHRRNASLDDASMSDLTSTSYQNTSGEFTPASILPNQNLNAGAENQQPLPCRPLRITHRSRLESIPSVGYVNSTDEDEIEKQQQTQQRRCDHGSDDDEYHAHSQQHHIYDNYDCDYKKQLLNTSYVQTDVTDISTSMEDSESEWTSHSTSPHGSVAWCHPLQDISDADTRISIDNDRPLPNNQQALYQSAAYANEFRHRHHRLDTLQAYSASLVSPVYDRDGRHVDCVELDLEDPYLRRRESFDEDEDDASHYHFHHYEADPLHYPKQHHLYQRNVPASSAIACRHDGNNYAAGRSTHIRPNGPAPYGVPYTSLKQKASAGDFCKVVRRIFVLGALGATFILIRVHLILAGRFSTSSIAAALTSSGISRGAGVAAIRLADGGFALPPIISNLQSSVATREALQSERAILKKRIKRAARSLPGDRTDILGTSNDGTYAVRLLTTPGRNDLTDAAIDRLSRCTSIADVRISSQGTGALRGLGGWGDEGSVLKRPGLTTDAVLLLADDLAFTCEELDRAFGVWVKNPERMVGFYPYSLLPNRNQEELAKPRSTLYGLGEIERGTGTYSVLSDRAAFVHSSYLTSAFTKAATEAALQWQKYGMPSSVGDSAQNLNDPCESFSLSIATTAVSNEAPIAIASRPLELRSWSIPSEELSASAAECLLEVASTLDLQVLPSEKTVFVGAVAN